MAAQTQSVLGFGDAAHLLRRAGFGARSRSEVEALIGLTREQAVDRVMSVPAPQPSSDTPGRHASPEVEHEGEYELWIDAVQYWLDRMAFNGSPFQEKLTLFWHGHFTTSQDKIYDARRGWQQIQLLRRLGAGGFDTLLHAVAIDPAMLLYLDNASNTKARPQENWAREVLELFTLGAGNYSQADVVDHARAWTGHGLVGPRIGEQRYAFHPDQHDDGLKTIFGIRRAWNGPDVLAEICTNQSGSGKRDVMTRHVARRMWTFFASPNPRADIVESLASSFASSGLSIAALARAIFLHDEFWSPATRNGLVRSPVDYVVASMRGVGRSATELHPDWSMPSMGQELMNPPNVAGWQPNGAWLSTTAVSARATFARQLMWGAFDPAKGWAFPMTRTTCDPASGFSDASLVTMVLDAFGVFEPSATTFETLLEFVQARRRTWYVADALMIGAMCCPEMQLA